MSKKITALYERSAAPNPEHIRRQKNNLETFAQAQGFTNLQHFTDDGYAAQNYDRPGFTALWAQMQLGEIGTIIVTDMARLSRDFLAISTFRDMLQMKDIRLIAILERSTFCRITFMTTIMVWITRGMVTTICQTSSITLPTIRLVVGVNFAGIILLNITTTGIGRWLLPER